MNLTRLKLVVIIILIIINVSCLKINEDSKKETSDIHKYLDLLTSEEKRICGFWGDEFPVPSDIYGFVFLPDKTFIYYDNRIDDNIKSKYEGTYGNWIIEENFIKIKIISNFYWKDNYIDTPLGYNAGEGNLLIQRDLEIKEWLILGEFNEIEPETEDEYDGERILIPERGNFYPIIDGNLYNLKFMYFKLEEIGEVLEDKNLTKLNELTIIEKYNSIP